MRFYKVVVVYAPPCGFIYDYIILEGCDQRSTQDNYIFNFSPENERLDSFVSANEAMKQCLHILSRKDNS